MGTIRGGGIVCDKCGADCKALYGFAMSVDRAAHNFNVKVKEIVDKVDKAYGKHDFVLCWPCTIAMMGIPTLEDKKDIPMVETVEPKGTVALGKLPECENGILNQTGSSKKGNK